MFAFIFHCCGGAVAGIYFVVTGQGSQSLQGKADGIPVACRQVCSAAGTLEQCVAAEDSIAADEADGTHCVTGCQHYFEFHVTNFYYVAFIYQFIGMDHDSGAYELRNVQGGVCEYGHFLCTANDLCTQFFRQFVYGAYMVIVAVCQQDVCYFQVVLCDIVQQGLDGAVAVDDTCDAVIIGNNVVVCAHGACCVACDFHFEFLLVFSDIFSNYNNQSVFLQ